MRLLFDQGTLVLAEAADEQARRLPGVAWDPRVALFRAPARCYGQIVSALDALGIDYSDEVRAASPAGEEAEAGPWRDVALRPYQQAALLAWRLAGQRGIAALPTGSGKTRLALAALATLRAPALCMVPTRALLRQWIDEIGNFYGGSVGCLGDGERTLSDLSIATFESAYRWMPRIGRRFELLIVDEVHHFGSGIRDDALEMCTARARLGLTATPPPDSALDRLEQMVGPIVYQLGVGDLTGKWLAAFDRVVLRLPLDDHERSRYLEDYGTFRAVHAELTRHDPGAGWEEFAAIARSSPEGRAAIAAWRRARHMLGLTRAKRAAVANLLARHRDSRVLVFTGDNEAAYSIAREHLVMPITCDISRAEREHALDAFRSGELRTLVSSRVLNEGIDVPDADVAIMVAGTRGEREYVQRVGRLLRPRAGKRAVVYELVTLGTAEARTAAQHRRSLAVRHTGFGLH
jgi:superfamily II DNA or RNA helicase